MNYLFECIRNIVSIDSSLPCCIFFHNTVCAIFLSSFYYQNVQQNLKQTCWIQGTCVTAVWDMLLKHLKIICIIIWKRHTRNWNSILENATTCCFCGTHPVLMSCLFIAFLSIFTGLLLFFNFLQVINVSQLRAPFYHQTSRPLIFGKLHKGLGKQL